ncbi:MAG: WbqC family protein [Prevotella sp.]|nr:WbqC family protein [Prevotella sp.]
MVTLHTTYFGPVQWYQQLYRSECVYIDRNERWQKQTIRNRCYIATANGVQALSVPIVHKAPSLYREGRGGSLTSDIRISDHGKWRREHWNALQSAYGESPFFDYYADDIRPFFTEKWEFLFDFNLAIIHKMCELLDIEAHIKPHPLSPSPKGEGEAFGKGGESLNPSSLPYREGRGGSLLPYYQVYQQKHGFLPNLSILDLLFNMGNEAILYL